ncbi:MAG: FAD-binding oxidoreductase [Gammaproteobacteria bacterium]|nr:FAD-binding oxidoreductase [Gammaproteobacteria bacterium]
MSNKTVTCEVIICGQGIAGTTLAWTLLDKGMRVMVIDRGDLDTASRVAAGLITPVSGRRFTVAPGFDQLMVTAKQHYQRVSNAIGHECLAKQTALRLCLTPDEQEMLASRRAGLGSHIAPMDPPPAASLTAALDGFAMPDARRLSVNCYLNRSRAFFTGLGIFLETGLDPLAVRPDAEGVIVTTAPHGVTVSAQYLVFCGGVADTDNSWLPDGVFNSAKGEILTLRIPGYTEQRTIHAAGIWLAPTSRAQIYRCGATYDHENLSTGTTAAASRQLASQLRRFLDLPFTIVDQRAAIRPVGMGRMPIIGRHQQFPQIAWFNGLGSKGALWAPALARSFAAHLLEGTPLDLDLVRAPGARAAGHGKNRSSCA